MLPRPEAFPHPLDAAQDDGRLARLSRIATSRPVAMGAGGNASLNGGTYSFAELWSSESEFDFVRLIYANARGGTTYAVAAATIAPTATTTLRDQPTDREGAVIPYSQVTFNNGGADWPIHQQMMASMYAAPAAVKSLDFQPLPGVAAGVNPWTPQLVFSDWMALTSVPRHDTGPGRLLSIRSLITSGQNVVGINTRGWNGIDKSDPVGVTGRSYTKGFGAGDLVTGSPSFGIDQFLGYGIGLVYGVQFHSRIRGATVQAVGDSILQGVGFRSGEMIRDHTGVATLCCAAASSPACPVSLLQSASGGEPSLDFYRSAVNDLKHADVAVALIQTWSGNDISATSTPAQSVAAADAAWGRAMNYGELVRRQGGVPIFLSAVPQATKMGSLGAEAARLSSARRCAELASHGEVVLDLNQLLGDGAAIANYQPRWQSLDNTHPGTPAHQAMADALLPMIRRIIGQRS